MATLRNHKQFWMRDDAEASLARWEADHGTISVNSAGRYEWEQQDLIDRWIEGGWQNRPPYLYEPKRPARASAHVANGGRAFDTPEWRRFLASSADYGWVQVYPWDVVHFEYFPERDKHRNRPAGGSASKPLPQPTPEPEPIPDTPEEDEMPKNVMHHKINADKRMEVKVSNPGSGFELNFITGSKDTLQAFADQYETGNSQKVSASVFRVIAEACAAVRPQGTLAITLGDADE